MLKRMRFFRTIPIAATAIAMAIMANPAQADTVMLDMQAAATGATTISTGPSSTGSVSLTGDTIGAFSLQNATGGFFNVIGMDLGVLTVSIPTETSTQTLTIDLSATGFTLSSVPGLAEMVTNFAAGVDFVYDGSTLSTVQFQAWVNTNNMFFQTSGSPSTDTKPLTIDNYYQPAISNLLDIANVGSSPFALDVRFIWTVPANQAPFTIYAYPSSFLAAVPEPASIVSCLTSLPCLGIAAWVLRRRKLEAKT